MSYLVLHVRPWALNDEVTKELREGLTVTYIDPTTPPQEGEVGIPPLNITGDKGLMPSFSSAPGLYDLSFTQRRGKGGKPQLVLNGANLQKPVKLASTPSQ